MKLTLEGARVERWGEVRLGPLDLDIEVTGTIAVMGPNGAGKSLFLRLLHGLTDPEAGRVLWDGAPPAETRAKRGFVFQSPPVLRRSVAANLRFPLRAGGEVPEGRVEELLALARLTPLAAQPAATLSGGERMRLALAQALARRPNVLLLDEPGANLDPTELARLEALIATVRADGAAVLMATHNLGQARRLSDRVLFFNGGKLAADLGSDAFFSEETPQSVRDFKDGGL